VCKGETKTSQIWRFLWVMNSPFDTFDIRRLAETKFSPNESALIGLRFSEASLVTAAWLITAPGPGTLEGDQR
jgi:hypothetical protein